jgi:hypothetical protein
MASNQRIFNESRRWFIKRSQAIGRVEHCVSAWVEFGVSIRDLSLAESNAKRSEQMREPLEWAEMPGLIYRPSERGQVATRQGYALIREANDFCLQQ